MKNISEKTRNVFFFEIANFVYNYDEEKPP